MHFKKIPFTYFICKKFGHMARECMVGRDKVRFATRKENEDVEETKDGEESDGDSNV